MSETESLYPRWMLSAARLGYGTLAYGMFIAAAAAALGWKPGVAIALAAAFGIFVVHLVIGVAAYRNVMRRDWPAVEPLTDDDEDEW